MKQIRRSFKCSMDSVLSHACRKFLVLGSGLETRVMATMYSRKGKTICWLWHVYVILAWDGCDIKVCDCLDGKEENLAS